MNEEALKKQIGSKIKQLRTIKGWSRQAAADELEMSLAGYGCIERGETDMCVVRLAQIAKIFEVNLNISFGLDEKTTINFTQQDNKECNNWHNSWQVNSSPNEIKDLLNQRHELEKSQLIQQSQTTEIENLKQQIIQLQEINQLLKQSLK